MPCMCTAFLLHTKNFACTVMSLKAIDFLSCFFWVAVAHNCDNHLSSTLLLTTFCQSSWSGDLKSRFVWISNGLKEVGMQSGFQMGSEIQKPSHLKSGQMGAILSKTIWNPIFKILDNQIPTVVILLAASHLVFVLLFLFLLSSFCFFLSFILLVFVYHN